MTDPDIRVNVEQVFDGDTLTNVVDLTPVVAELFSKKIPYVQALTIRRLIKLLEERVASGKVQTVPDVLDLLRFAAEFHENADRAADDA